MNQIHPSLKFTLNHTSNGQESMEDRCPCVPSDSIPFLDTSLSVINGKIDVDLYKKKTDRSQYLLRESCHNRGVTLNIPYSLSLRIIRICTNKEKALLRLQELKQVLLARKYPLDIIDGAINKALKVPRKVALLKVVKKTSKNRPVFALQYDPRLPAIQSIQAKHWRSMVVQDQYLADCFKQPPLTAFRRQTNL